MTPALNVVHVNTVSMMASSPTSVYNKQAGGSSQGLTKERGDWDIWNPTSMFQ